MITAYTREAEIKLVEKTSAVKNEPMSWRAIYFRFSQLLDQYKSDYQRKIALNVVLDHVKDSEGGIYVCGDQDIFLLCNGIGRNTLERLTFQLRYLFSDDPLAYTIDGAENPEFCTIYDLSVAWEAFYDVCKKKLMLLARRDMLGDEGKQSDAIAQAASVASKRGKAMTPTRLADIEKELAKADLSRVLRRQPICAAPPGKELRKVFDEYYINIAHLQRLIMADVTFTSNRWLFKYLTQVLDNKMLEMLGKRPTMYFDSPVSLNLNIDTLLSEKFFEFDAEIKPATKVSIVIEINIADVFANMEAFIRSKNAVQKLGYRVCLDGLTPLSFPQVDRERLGFDIAKLQWDADLDGDMSSAENQRIKHAVKQYGPNRVILCRCDTKSAIDYGQSLGISLFQGRYLDYLLNPQAKVIN